MAAAASALAASAAAARTCLSVLSSASSIKFRIPLSRPSASLKFSFLPSVRTQKLFFLLRPCSAAQHTDLEEKKEMEDTQEGEAGESIWQGEGNRRKLYVVNLPWSYSASDLENLFGQCGTVNYVEELAGRIIKVQLAKSFYRPSSKKPRPITPVGETRHKIYVGNLHWKVRAGNLREFFSAKFKPVSARVVFDNPTGRSAGYGFVSFDTKEEVETAISELDGVELMGRPLRLRVSQRKGNESETGQEGSFHGHSEGS